jgi:ribosomal protein L12E/L44/L45/RPP1/RPP2
VKLEPRFHSAISAGLRGVSPKRIRVLRASLAAAAAAAAAAAVAAARGGGTAEKSATQENRKRLCLCF